MLNHKLLSKEYQAWIERHIEDFISGEKVEWQPSANYLDHNGLFVTVIFNKNLLYGRQSDLNASEGPQISPGSVKETFEQSLMFQTFGHLFKGSIKHVLGSNYHRMRNRQPCAIACGDVNGTRYGFPETGENPHIHSLWVFRKNEKRLYQDYLINVAEHKIRAISDIDVQELTNIEMGSKRGNRAVSYMTKFLGRNAQTLMMAEDFMIYPTPKVTQPRS